MSVKQETRCYVQQTRVDDNASVSATSPASKLGRALECTRLVAKVFNRLKTCDMWYL